MYFAHFADGFDFRWGGDCGAVGAVFLHWHARGWGVSDDEAGDHDEEEDTGEREDGEKVGVETDEGVDCKGRESMRWLLPL